MKRYLLILAATAGSAAWSQDEYFHTPPYKDLADFSFQDTNGDGTDGTLVGPIFVASWGNDVWPGSRFYPKKTLNAATIAAYVLGRSEIYISSETFTTGPTVVFPGQSLVSGFDSNWRRQTFLRATLAPATSLTSLGVLAPEVRPGDHFLNFDINAPGGTAGSGESSIGFMAKWAIPGTPIAVWSRNRIVTGNGASGATGTTGANGTPGGTGVFVGGFGDDGNSGGGGGGGERPVDPVAHAGFTGLYNFEAYGGAGGAPGTESHWNGYNGVDGTSGAHGLPAQPQSAELVVNGISGSNGFSGRGGGGGGGSRDNNKSGSAYYSGSSGGGGGGGGSKGLGGGGGQAGGSSVGLLIQNSNSGYTGLLGYFDVVTANGGQGGSGGHGGDGAIGGAGGPGDQHGDAGHSGAGGRGGNGGSGAGGNGGGGGWSACVFNGGYGNPFIGTHTWSHGAGALGGPGGFGGSGAGSGSAGPAGQAADVVTGQAAPTNIVFRAPALYGTHLVAEALVNSTKNRLTPIVLPIERTFWLIFLTNPSHGTIKFFTNPYQPYFEYTPTPGYVGYDTVTYGAQSGTAYIEGVACIYVSPSVPVHIDLGDWQGSPAAQNFQVEFTDPASGAVIRTETGSTDSSGNGSIGVPNSALKANVRIKHSHWLSQVRPYDSANPHTLQYNLINGDCDGDDSITVFDYSILSDSFDKAWGTSGYDDRADLDGDFVVTVFDYSILSDHFDLSGPRG